jgi:outer membrane protein
VGGAGRVRALAGVVVLAAFGVGAGGPAGASPLSDPMTDSPERELRRAVRLSTERELAEMEMFPERVRLTAPDRTAELLIAPEILQQLERMAGPAYHRGRKLDLGRNLFGREQAVEVITLERAIKSAVQHNLNVEFARLAPAISQAQVTAAEAAFDWTLFSNSQWSRNDRQTQATQGFSPPANPQESLIQTVDQTLGVRRALISGGQLTVQTQYTYTDNETRGIFATPDPAHESNVAIQLDQPLLRNFGSEVTLAQVRLARNAERDQIEQLEGTLLDTVRQVEEAYWGLVRAQSDLRILQSLLERGEQVLDVLRKRGGFDAKPANLANAAAAVEERRSNVIRGQRVLRDASDTLKGLVNDPEIVVGSEVLILPADEPITSAIEFSLLDVMDTALKSRPELQRALLSIDNTAIRFGAARNAALPQLNLRTLVRFNGLGRGWSSSTERMTDGEFVDWQIGLAFEQPIGNRAAESVVRQRRLERQQAVIAYRNTVPGIIADVKRSLRDVETNYRLIAQSRTARIAAANDLRALEVEEQALQGLTPEFLNLKLGRQQSLAAAEQQEVTAMVDYNTSLARLYSAMGTALERNRIIFSVPAVRPETRDDDLFPDWPAMPARDQ